MVGVKFHSGLRMVMLELFTREEQREPNRDTWLLCPKLKSSSPRREGRVLEANLSLETKQAYNSIELGPSNVPTGSVSPRGDLSKGVSVSRFAKTREVLGKLTVRRSTGLS